LQAKVKRAEEEVDLREGFAALAARWKTLLLAALIGGIVFFAISKLLPKTYASAAIIYVQENSLMAGLQRQLPFPLPGKTGDQSGYLRSLLESASLRQAVLAQLSLEQKRQLAGRAATDEEKLDRNLADRISIKQDQNQAINIIAQAPNPQLAALLANALLDDLSGRIAASSSHSADFIGDKIKQTDKALQEAEGELLQFQQKNDVALIDEETKALVQQLSDFDSQLLQQDMELQQVSSELANGGDPARLIQLQVRKKSLDSSIGFLKGEIEKLRKKLADAPAVALHYARIQRNIAVLDKTYQILTEQYQLAMISQHGQGGDFQIIDRARPNSLPAAPRARVNGVFGALLGFLLGIILVLRKNGSRPLPAKHQE
jgi:uncharacterized protein involved in exopolysaccharide biosynthesis